MKAGVFALLLVFCFVECKKTYAPIDKNANLAFINMEGGGVKPGSKPGLPAVSVPAKPPSPAPTPAPKPVVPTQAPAKSIQQAPEKPAQPATVKPAPAVTPPVPQKPSQIKPVPVNPAPVGNPVTTPGPGSVKDLVNFYNSQGKASSIRPYSYSQAVKQG